jgi:hypothetical protein
VHDPENPADYSYVLHDGSRNGVRLYHHVWKVYDGEQVFNREKYQKVLSTKDHYTLVTPDGTYHHVKRLTDVTRLFPAQKRQLRLYAKSNRLSFSKREREQSLAAIVSSLSGRPATSAPSTAAQHADSPQATLPAKSTVAVDEQALVAGIPVLDNDSIARSAGSTPTRTYVIPGVTKAKASVADDQELAEIVVVGGRQSAVQNMMMGSEKFKPQILKNIPSAFGESDIMKIVLTLPGVTTVGEASS